MFAPLPSGSSEKSVSEENRVSVSLVNRRTLLNKIPLQMWLKHIQTWNTDLLSKGEIWWYFWCGYHFCNIFWKTSMYYWLVVFRKSQTGKVACDLKHKNNFENLNTTVHTLKLNTHRFMIHHLVWKEKKTVSHGNRGRTQMLLSRCAI